ncbi:hypothetical protein GCM10007094_23430 [Pseudovibrio japonicus]|uniref:Uncharacterized protein n=1 Tax=Pseudovibrio japonicus TaxID=366534 RepID=A0ABQ3ECQ0_9HYPH|nr:hypothetical protein GCM10007094_23430 [Pseudovibrio japonicus]
MNSKVITEDQDLQKKEPLSIEKRFNQLVEWAQDEGLEVLISSYILLHFDKRNLKTLSDFEKAITYGHLRKAIVMTRHNRKASYDKYH